MKKFIVSLIFVCMSFCAFAQDITFNPFGLGLNGDVTTQISLSQLTLIQDTLKSVEKERDDYKALYEKEHEENIQFRKDIEKLLSEQKDSIVSAETSVDSAITTNQAIEELNKQLLQEVKQYQRRAEVYKWVAIGTTALCLVTGTTLTVLTCVK